MIDYIALLRRHEGVRSKVYKDSLGIETIGVGFNLRRPDARLNLRTVGADYDAVLSGKAILSDTQINALLNDDVRACLVDLKILFPDFDVLPIAAREVLVDMRFQLGGGGLRAFKNTLANLQTHKWKAAAAGMRSSLAYKQTTSRWEENAQRLESIKP